ncbi:hypothetical protein CC79DRAFT_1396954 [Sarocladium strictum]
MRSHDAMKNEEANQAAWEASKGGLVGAAKMGVVTAILGAVGFGMSPLYRGTTIQFKVYLQMSGMVLGGMVAAEHRLQEFEAQMRYKRRMIAEKERWERYEHEFSGSEGK